MQKLATNCISVADASAVKSRKDYRFVESFVKKLAAVIVLGALSLGWPVQSSAQLRQNGVSESRASRKAAKKQLKAQKKYAKAQRKAQRKMLKTERKNTRYPSR